MREKRTSYSCAQLEPTMALFWSLGDGSNNAIYWDGPPAASQVFNGRWSTLLYPLPTDELESRAVAGSSLIPVDFLVAYSPASWWTTNVRRLGCQVARRSMTRSYSPFRAHQVDPERPMGLTSWGTQQVLMPREPGPMFPADVPSRQGSQGFSPSHCSHPKPSAATRWSQSGRPAATIHSLDHASLGVLPQPCFRVAIEPWRQPLPQSAPPHSMLPYRAVTYRLHENTRIGKV